MNENTLTYDKTIEALTRFHDDCIKYWQSEGHTFEESVILARKDVQNAKNDPFEPKGRPLNMEAKNEFLISMES